MQSLNVHSLVKHRVKNSWLVWDKSQLFTALTGYYTEARAEREAWYCKRRALHCNSSMPPAAGIRQQQNGSCTAYQLLFILILLVHCSIPHLYLVISFRLLLAACSWPPAPGRPLMATCFWPPAPGRLLLAACWLQCSHMTSSSNLPNQLMILPCNHDVNQAFRAPLQYAVVNTVITMAS